MMLQELIKKINKKLDTNALPPRVIQSKFKTGFDKPTPLLNDPTYLPLFYHLGKMMSGSNNLIEFGFDLGMTSGCFIEGCSSVKSFLAFRKKSQNFYPKRLGVANIHNVLKNKFDLWIGEETDPEFIKMVFGYKWDCAIISDVNQKDTTYRAYLDLVWNQMSSGGIIVLDNLSDDAMRKAVESFCKSQRQELATITTLRGTGILQR